MISERATFGVVHKRSKVQCDYIKRNKKYHGKLILSKHRSQLTGELMGMPTKKIASNQTAFNDPIIDDIAICNCCQNYGLWGDKCDQCKHPTATYLKIIAECVLCSQQGELGYPCNSCIRKDRKVTPIFGVQVKARRNPGILNIKTNNSTDTNRNPTYIIPQVMLYNLETGAVGRVSR